METLAEGQRTCETCTHKNDKGTEHCGSCGGTPPHAWEESPYHLEARADKIIDELRERAEKAEADVSETRRVAGAFVVGLEGMNAEFKKWLGSDVLTRLVQESIEKFRAMEKEAGTETP